MNHSTLQRRGFTFWQVVLVLASLVILAALLFPLLGRTRENGHYPSCQSNLKQIMLGVRIYLQDYDEKYPLIALNAKTTQIQTGRSFVFGWADSLQPYLKSTQIFQCPQEKTAPDSDPTHSGYTDYWFNAKMAGLKEKQLDAEALTIALSDGNSGDARSHLFAIPNSWRSDSNSPLYRHLNGANYAFGDGHVKWLSPDKWKNELDMQGGPTLRLKPKN